MPSAAGSPEHPWDRGGGYPRDDKGLPRERVSSYEKFLHYLHQGPGRTKASTAKQCGLRADSIYELASKFSWDQRCHAYDQSAAVAPAVAPLPERLVQAATQAAALVPRQDSPMAVLEELPEDLLAREREHEDMLEQFRLESEQLGRSQMTVARAMTSMVSKSLRQMVDQQKTLDVRSIPSFVSAACSLAASAHHTWGRAIGVDRLLLQMERSVMEAEQQVIEDAEVIG